MRKRANRLGFAIIISVQILAAQGLAVENSFNLGFQNPRYSNLGFNYLADFQPFAMEIGAGEGRKRLVRDDSNQLDLRTKKVFGEADLKYYFFTQTFRPYAEFGTAIHWLGRISRNEFTAGFRTGHAFAGIGLRIDLDRLYGYTAGQWSPGELGYCSGIGYKLSGK